jgi:hypothetical protein
LWHNFEPLVNAGDYLDPPLYCLATSLEMATPKRISAGSVSRFGYGAGSVQERDFDFLIRSITWSCPEPGFLSRL